MKDISCICLLVPRNVQSQAVEPLAGSDLSLLYAVESREPKPETNHESTKTGKHEKKPIVL